MYKVTEGRPHICRHGEKRRDQLHSQYAEGSVAIIDSAALRYKVFCLTTLAAAEATLLALRHGNDNSIRFLQEIAGSATPATATVLN